MRGHQRQQGNRIFLNTTWPPWPGPGNPQIRNSINFLIGVGGTLAIAELVYNFYQEPTPSLLLSDVTVGGWYHSVAFPDQHVDTMGVSPADHPSSSGIPALHQGNYGPYLTVTEGFDTADLKEAKALLDEMP